MLQARCQHHGSGAGALGMPVHGCHFASQTGLRGACQRDGCCQLEVSAGAACHTLLAGGQPRNTNCRGLALTGHHSSDHGVPPVHGEDRCRPAGAADEVLVETYILAVGQPAAGQPSEARRIWQPALQQPSRLAAKSRGCRQVQDLAAVARTADGCHFCRSTRSRTSHRPTLGAWRSTLQRQRCRALWPAGPSSASSSPSRCVRYCSVPPSRVHAQLGRQAWQVPLTAVLLLA